MNYRPGLPVTRVKQKIELPTKQVIRQTVSSPMRTVKFEPPKNIIQPKPQTLQQPVAKPQRHDLSKQQAAPASRFRQQQINRPKKEPTYKTRDVSGDDLNKIASIKDTKRGKILVIIANGPSISEVRLHDLKTHSNLETLMINKPDDRVWPTDHWAFFDLSQLRRHEAYLQYYQGTIFNSTAIKRQSPNSMQFKNLGGRGFSFDLLKGVHIGRSSVYAAMQIALWMNYDKVFIFGCDMDPNGINGQLHFYGTNPDVNPEVRKERFKIEATYYDEAADMMSADQKERFYFCSSYNRWGFVNKFKYLDHKTAVQQILRGF